MNIFTEYFLNRASHCIPPSTQQPASPLIPVIQRGSRLKEWMQWGILECWASPVLLKSSHWIQAHSLHYFASLFSHLLPDNEGVAVRTTSKQHIKTTHSPHLTHVLLIVTLSLASLSWSSSSEKLKPATVMKSPITATNLSPRSLVLLCW